MNIYEAIKSGRPFKRKTVNEWLVHHNDGFGDKHGPFETLDLCKEDLLADDWEIQEITVPVSRTQLARELSEIYKQVLNDKFNYIIPSGPSAFKLFDALGEHLYKRLGLE